MNDAPRYSAACSCSAVTVTACRAPRRVGICHCDDCRRHHGALFYAAAIFERDAATISGNPRSFNGRHFCPHCGASVFAISGDEIEIHLGAMDDKHGLTPDYECWTIRRAAWLAPISDAAQYEEDRDSTS